MTSVQSHDISNWLVTEAPTLPSCRHVLEQLVARLNENGMELNRVSFGIDVLHPELLGKAYVWERTGQHVSEREIHHCIQSTNQYLNNLYSLLNDGELSVRRNPADPGAIEEFPMMEELRDAGVPDYITIVLPRSDRDLYRTYWSTDREGGFTD